MIIRAPGACPFRLTQNKQYNSVDPCFQTCVTERKWKAKAGQEREKGRERERDDRKREEGKRREMNFARQTGLQ